MFAELLARSNFSFLTGASHPEELVVRAKELGLAALALTDRMGLYGSVRAHAQAKESEQRVIVGAELVLDPGVPSRSPTSPSEARLAALAKAPSVALLARDHGGYSNLCRLLTLAHAGHPKGEGALRLEDLASHHQGLVAVVPAPRDPSGPDAPPAELCALLHDRFGERAFLAAHRHLDAFDAARLAEVERCSERYGLDVVASARPLFHHRSRKLVADVVACIREGTTLDRAGTLLSANGEAFLRSELEMQKLFRDQPAWVERTAEVAAECRFSLSELRYHFPCTLEPGESADQKLRRLTLEGARGRYPGGVPEGVALQVEKELALIAQLSVAPYFLSTWEIVEIARSKRILCQGRGSAANSAVCYALGITAVDPARSNLLFERFMSAERSEPPDIDIDFEHERREEVIQEIYARWGRDRATMVSEVICYRGKSALREVGKVFGLSLEQIDRLSGTITHWDSAEVSDSRLAEMGFDSSDSRLRQSVMLARAIEGFPRHLSIHVGGFVLSARPLHEVAPIEPARMPERTVMPWDKDDIEALGFFKIDVLGLGMLTAIRKCLALIWQDGGLGSGQRSSTSTSTSAGFDPIQSLARVPPEDPTVYDLCSRADTVGVFQIESRAQMAMLPRLKPRRFYDLVVEVAIVRPGPIQGGMVHPYLRRRNGEEAVVSPHPSLWPILERTLGVPLFQEQVMQIAIVGAGYSGGEADQLRRDMAAWKKNGKLLRHKDRLLQGFAARGISADFGARLFEQIKGFGEYGFPECVVGDTLVLDAGTGRRVRIEDVVEGRVKLGSTLACDSRLRLRKRRVLRATASGLREVFLLRTALGREITATPEHPLLTVAGWRPLASLRPGDHVAVARGLPSLGRRRWPRHEIVALADLVAEGNLCHPTTFYFYTRDLAHRDEFVRMVERFPNTRATVRRHHDCFSIHVRRADRRRPCGALVWAERFGLRGKNAYEKRLPDAAFELSKADLSLLLARLWEGDGHLSVARHASYDTASRELAEQVQHLLLRLGIVSRVYTRTRPYRERTFTGYTVTVTGKENLERFSTLVARRFLSAKKRNLARQLARAPSGRMSRDIVPAQVRAAIRDAREASGETWVAIGRATGLGMREIQGRGATKRGFQRWVVERLGRHLRSRALKDLGRSDLYWDRVISVERVGHRETYDLTIDGDPNFLANDFVVHNSHAASFALLVYTSAWQKAHFPAHFACALVNSLPMGFYSASTIFQDAQRHGVELRDVDVGASAWNCTLEPASEKSAIQSRFSEAARAIRLGLRLVKGFAEESARRIEAARAEAAFGSLDDLIRRARLRKDEVEKLAEAGALESLVAGRRHAVWQSRAPRVGGLFEKLDTVEPRIALPPLRAAEQLLLDYERKGLSVSDHPLRHLRERLRARGVVSAAELPHAKQGSRVSVAGLVLTRQQPGTASGVVFITLEDETGFVNLILWNAVYERLRLIARHSTLLLAHGKVERDREATAAEVPILHVIVEDLERLDRPEAKLRKQSRDFH